MKKPILSLLSLCLSLVCLCATAEPIVIGEKKPIFSKLLDEHRYYTLYLPASYHNAKLSDARYPVIYLLDGDHHFTHTVGIVEELSDSLMADIPESIIVGIGNTNRFRDYTPTHTLYLPNGDKGHPGYKDTGGASRFLYYLEQELVPHIEQNYRTTGPNILIGHSFGGLVTLEALRSQRNAFQAYLTIDPSLWFDAPDYKQQLTTDLLETRFDYKALFLASANNPVTPSLGRSTVHRDTILAFGETLKTDTPKGLDYSSRYYEDRDHSSVVHPAIYDGLRRIYRGYQVPFLREEQSAEQIKQRYRDLSGRLGVEIKPQLQLLLKLDHYVNRNQYLPTDRTLYRRLLAEYYPAYSSLFAKP